MKRLLGTTALAAIAAVAMSADAQAVDLVFVSWGGAYTASQQKAYHDPYMAANPDVKIVNDDSSGSTPM